MTPARDASMIAHAIASFLIVVAMFLVTDSASAPSLASPRAHGARSDSPSPFTATERRTGSADRSDTTCDHARALAPATGT